jgi:hypothetical protein
MSAFPNTETKKRGDFVRAVHPLTAGRYPDGVVLQADGPCECGADFCGTREQQISVATGRGSHVYGPARNWAVIDEKPEWLVRYEGDDDAA